MVVAPTLNASRYSGFSRILQIAVINKTLSEEAKFCGVEHMFHSLQSLCVMPPHEKRRGGGLLSLRWKHILNPTVIQGILMSYLIS